MTTDIHSQLCPYIKDKDLIGGLAILSDVVQKLRRNYGKDSVIWIDTGDPVVDMSYDNVKCLL